MIAKKIFCCCCWYSDSASSSYVGGRCCCCCCCCCCACAESFESACSDLCRPNRKNRFKICHRGAFFSAVAAELSSFARPLAALLFFCFFIVSLLSLESDSSLFVLLRLLPGSLGFNVVWSSARTSRSSTAAVTHR